MTEQNEAMNHTHFYHNEHCSLDIPVIHACIRSTDHFVGAGYVHSDTQSLKNNDKK